MPGLKGREPTTETGRENGSRRRKMRQTMRGYEKGKLIEQTETNEGTKLIEE